MHNNTENLNQILANLIKEWENELVEFKNPTESYDHKKIGNYFSALANEANLKNREITGTSLFNKQGQEKIKLQMSQMTEPATTFKNIHELQVNNYRVIMFEIPSALSGMPISCNGHYYGRSGESLVALGIGKLEEIRKKGRLADWTAEVIPNATITHLDETALDHAKRSFAEKHKNRFKENEVQEWSHATFLDRAKITIEGKITRTALLLLGKAESAYLLLHHPAQLTWGLESEERAYEHFGPPFVLTTSSLYQKIRNIQLRILPAASLLPQEIAKYDKKILMEGLHNCIAHQDYFRNSRIVVTEYLDRLVLENSGNFFDGKPDDYMFGEKTPRNYRNPFLVNAMVALNMIDTMGYGIHDMYLGQAKRYLPMPDYDLTTPNLVKLTLHGKIIDPIYSQILIQKTDLSLAEICAIDRVQKKLPLDDGSITRLRRKKLIEGRKPNFYLSASIASATQKKAEYIRTRAQNNDYYEKLICDYLIKFKEATRKEINDLLWQKLSDGLNEEQKDNKIASILTKLRRVGAIKNIGPKKIPRWTLKTTT